MNRQKQNAHKYIYLDHERLTYNDKTLTASATTKFALDQFVGKCPFIIVVIKSNSSPVASDKSLFDYVEIGSDGTFDITNSGSQSLLGNGTAIKQDYLYELFTKQTGNPHIKGVYLIPFCDSVKKSIVGQVNGYFEFVGLKDYLEIAFPSAPTQEVHTITNSGTPAAGVFRYGFEKGGFAKNEIAFNDTIAVCKAQIEAMPEISERGYSVSLGATMGAGATQTLTFGTRDGQVSEELGLSTIFGGNGFVVDVDSSALTTKGKSGWTSGSSYQVEIHMYKYKELCVEKNGKITCRDL